MGDLPARKMQGPPGTYPAVPAFNVSGLQRAAEIRKLIF